METPLDLDGIIAKSREDGVLLKVDDRWTQHKIYRFILDTQHASDIVEQLIAEISQNQLYGVVPKGSKIINDGYRIEFGYRKPRDAQQKTRLHRLGQLTRELLTRSQQYDELNHFATILILDLSVEERLRLEKEGRDTKDKSVFVIDSLNIYDSQQATLNLMRTFYSAYQNLKTPSKTLPTHSPSQNP